VTEPFPVETVERLAQAKTLPVVETFGPTVQGEGALAGLPTMFVRLGYCDYRCEWCDSMFSVEPAQVSENAERLTAGEILERLRPGWFPGMYVTLSGGNPAIHDLTELVEILRYYSWRVAVETQGSIWRDWLATVDHLVVSPKPPSSGMATSRHREQTEAFLDAAQTWIPERQKRSIKIVVFDQKDLDWARELLVSRKAAMEWWDSFLSVGTPPITAWGAEWKHATSEAEVRRQVCDRYRWLCEAVAGDDAFVSTRVLPQLHVLAWSHSRGV
jgi:7-carboxy-7-deazaguanine synthase